MAENESAIRQKIPFRRAPKIKGGHRITDTTLGWVEMQYPQLTSWRALAITWMEGETIGIARRLKALVAFFERYLIQQNLPLDPTVLLARSTLLPDFYRTACPNSEEGIKYNNLINAFLHFVLLHEFSEANDDNEFVVSPAFHNPVPRLSDTGVRTMRDESVHSPLPYGYIVELRQMLAAGPHFRDWHWAQSALDCKMAQSLRSGPDWFQVTEDLVDRDDPDCVWRERLTKDGTSLEMWSPVRWVALLVKLILPLRTFQVRMLDSGEADTWRYATGNWALNSGRLAQGNERRPLQQGVFRRSNPLADGKTVSALLYINTNKTADIAKSHTEKGYLLPWSFGGPDHQDIFYWIEKLRNWQERYNPISRRTAWTELDSRHINAKSKVQLASYPDSCFLFRMPEHGIHDRHLPLREYTLSPAWFRLLRALEERISERKETHRNGTPIRFLPIPEERTYATATLFPLHSLRVSLITALVLEGQVPFPVMQKLIGHSRLIMTLYYTKPGATHIRDILLDAEARLNATKEASIQNFLLDTEYEELMNKTICNNLPSLAIAIPQHPVTRNLVGWMPTHHGLCLVGGNTSEIDDSVRGGCYNGGPNLGSASSPKYGPVPGGSRNCVRCRWFVTEPHHLPALAAHFNNIAYHFDEARNACLIRENELHDLKKQKVDAEDAGKPFHLVGAYWQAERVWESTIKHFSDLAEDLVACWRLIERCRAALAGPQGDGTQLIAVGTVDGVNVVFEETESELLQLAGVCANVEIYPDLVPGKAVFRRSQLLDTVLYHENLPPVFMLLNEQEQLLAGNAFMRRLAQQMNPANPALGQREVIRLVDAGESLSRHFGLDLFSLLPTIDSARSFSSGHQTITGDDI